MPTLSGYMSELEAVNIMLLTAGEAPVPTLPAVGYAYASIAQAVLAEVSREVQTRGYHWNTEDDYPLVPTLLNEVELPENALDFDPSDKSVDYVIRGRKLYDRTKHTFTITQEVKGTIILLLNFDELPQACRYYISIRAARKFQKRVLGADMLDKFTLDDEQRARIAMEDSGFDVADYSLLDNIDSFYLLSRTPRYGSNF